MIPEHKRFSAFDHIQAVVCDIARNIFGDNWRDLECVSADSDCHSIAIQNRSLQILRMDGETTISSYGKDNKLDAVGDIPSRYKFLGDDSLIITYHKFGIPFNPDNGWPHQTLCFSTGEFVSGKYVSPLPLGSDGVPLAGTTFAKEIMWQVECARQRRASELCECSALDIVSLLGHNGSVCSSRGCNTTNPPQKPIGFSHEP